MDYSCCHLCVPKFDVLMMQCNWFVSKLNVEDIAGNKIMKKRSFLVAKDLYGLILGVGFLYLGMIIF
jgi:hypothetical protein